MRKTISIVVLFILILTGCSSAQPSPTPTDIPTTTATRQATNTPRPTSTATPEVTPSEREIVDQNERNPVIAEGVYTGPNGQYAVDMRVRIITDKTLEKLNPTKPGGISSIYLNNVPNDDKEDWKNPLGEDAVDSILNRTTRFFYDGWVKDNEGRSYDEFMKLWTEAQVTGDYSSVQFIDKVDKLGDGDYFPKDMLITPGNLNIVFVNPNYFSQNLTTGIGKTGNHAGHQHALHVNKEGVLELWVGYPVSHRGAMYGPVASAFLDEAMNWAFRWGQAKQFSGRDLREFSSSKGDYTDIIHGWDEGEVVFDVSGDSALLVK